MGTTTLQFPVPAARTEPRGARLAAEAFGALLAGLAQLFRKAPLTRAQEAQAVFALAWQLRDTEPALAADLCAAACHHSGE
ncbi:MAG: hypothetical protein ABI574_08765 [Burkholderiales bacterium]